MPFITILKKLIFYSFFWLFYLISQVGQYDKVVSQMRQSAGPRADMSNIVDIIFAHKQYRYYHPTNLQNSHNFPTKIKKIQQYCSIQNTFIIAFFSVIIILLEWSDLKVSTYDVQN